MSSRSDNPVAVIDRDKIHNAIVQAINAAVVQRDGHECACRFHGARSSRISGHFETCYTHSEASALVRKIFG